MEWKGGDSMGTEHGGVPYLTKEEEYEYLNGDRFERNYGIICYMYRRCQFLFDMIYFNLNIKGKQC